MRAHAAIRTAVLLAALPWLLQATPAVGWQADAVADRAREARETLIPVPLDAADRAFVAYAVDRSRLTGQAMEIAMQRSPSPELQVLAESMHEEHLALTEALLELAGPDSPSTVTSVGEHAELVELRAVAAEQFDQHFIEVLRRLHADTAARYRQFSAGEQGGERVRRHARDALPVIELHRRLLDDAEALLADAGAGAGAVAEADPAADEAESDELADDDVYTGDIDAGDAPLPIRDD